MELADVEADLLCHFVEGIWALVDFGILRGPGINLPSIPNDTCVNHDTNDKQKILLSQTQWIQVCRITCNAIKYFLKTLHTHTQVKVTSECLEPVIAFCQSKGMNSPSTPFYTRGWSDVNIFLITLATPVPNSTPFPNSSPIPWPQTRKFSIRAFGLSLRFLYLKLQNHSQLDHFHSQIHAANWLCQNRLRLWVFHKPVQTPGPPP